MSGWKMPRGAGYKSSWIVVKGAKREDIVKRLELIDKEILTWDKGLGKVNNFADKKVIVSDDYEGINYIIGDFLFNLAYNDELLQYIAKGFEEVYYFYTHRVSESHGFAKLIKGEFIRKYYFDEEQLCDFGEITDYEDENGLIFPSDFNECYKDGFTTINEDNIIEIAEEWTGIDEESYLYDDVVCGSIKNLEEKFSI